MPFKGALRGCLLTGVVACALAGPLAGDARSATGKRCESTTSSGKLYAGPRTSCAFARRVERYVNARSIPDKVTLRSPVNGKRYTLHRTTSRTSPTGYRYVSRTIRGLWVREVY